MSIIRDAITAYYEAYNAFVWKQLHTRNEFSLTSSGRVDRYTTFERIGNLELMLDSTCGSLVQDSLCPNLYIYHMQGACP